MSSSISPVKPSSGIFALVTLMALATLGYAYYLIATEQHLDYQAAALVPVRYMVQPDSMMLMIAGGGFSGTLAAVLVKTFNAMFLGSIVFMFIYAIGLSRLDRKKADEGEKRKSPAGTAGEYSCEIPGSEMIISIPDSKDYKTGLVVKGLHDTAPYREVFFRCNRADIPLNRPAATQLEQLYVALYSMLAAHPDVPASVGAHHADTSLFEHSRLISNAVVKYMRDRGWDEPVAKVAGLAHDMDKLLAYSRKGKGWVKNRSCTHHNTYSAFIVSNQPEFLNIGDDKEITGYHKLGDDDRTTLVLALRYYHHPEMLPNDASLRVERLVQALRHVDGQVIASEKRSGIEQAKEAEGTYSLLHTALLETIRELNINAYLGTGRAGGWTKDAVEFVIVPMSTILEFIPPHLPTQLSRQLQVTVETKSYHHPAIPMLLESLEQMGLLMHQYKEMTSEKGLFDVRIGVQTFTACVLLNKEPLAEMLPTIVTKWGMTQYGIKIRKPTVDSHKDDLD
ncbi:hypothetical protein QAO71_17620 (plasmid) [Halopseudomonas sp. SMJS2]|uniref:hypothetical protein n=1 Tax=Halopseudomonas sp. SMJS2 TaxID=3041098 RepID=UPI0024533946|nr:hypothetical protein [Halopseudomonas sp. SMJS2]WGK63361.1 hypothetical protein QAO71_17620 [Halopseudomonas sp. SMJS2]